VTSWPPSVSDVPLSYDQWAEHRDGADETSGATGVGHVDGRHAPEDAPVCASTAF